MTTVAIAVATVALCLAQLWGEVSKESLRYVLYTLALCWAVGLACLATGLAGALRYRTWRLSLIAPVVAILSIAVACTGIPGKVGWALSKDALEQAAVTCAHTKETRLGVIRVTAIAKRDGGCWLYTHGVLTDSVGFAYFPDRAPVSSSPETSYTHLEGPWYRFYDGF
ncbi:hypothetical protein GCM10009764_35590 [Nocardia ninae]|uniref:Uncharacterized protein n=1 Tax=Nocardia ninae NBRC 108245 TaxID=1210091 RepID=A0A511MMC2_9NOCA|nr:hypothetical protein NN4_62930 [Nocardia ninae NBRC 108245]